MKHALPIALVLAPVLAGCAGPATYIDNVGQHRCYLDGVRETRPAIPFRYYGTSRIDVVPADTRAGEPDWDRQPMRLAVPVPPPASPWLFPLDFVIEAFDRAVAGRRDVVATIAPPPTPNELRVEPDVRPTGIEQVRARADAARIAR